MPAVSAGIFHGTTHMPLIAEAQQHAQRKVQSHAWGDVVWHVWGQEHAVDTTPLVLLHGGSGSWTHWVRNVQHLAQTRCVWALDLPGCGDSALPPLVSDADSLAPYVGEVLQQAFEGQAVEMLGFSFGGLTAGLLAAEHPKLFKQMIMVGIPALGLFEKTLPMRGMTPNMDERQQRAVHRHNLMSMMFAHESSASEEVVDLQIYNVSRDRLRKRRIARTDVLLGLQDRWTCPVHGIWGAKDALYKSTLERVPQVLHRLDSFHVVPDAGHWVMFEKPDAFHTLVNKLLAN
jgi:pimeloyl-ACP methyl ester carboxylesterase